ncbi:hypothetical protein [Pseudomonas sp. GM80]|uniref:hypothetical protein n=1 Tax=Pseudomonas sp. GM80 TaxID=1144339 RepID=UPI00026F9D53|nr:hypothetical protein [Pseudomonas sp. GM80]EJN34556.1 hypothetical protein PMI37_01029 [Pseudomonas sp. GM80]
MSSSSWVKWGRSALLLLALAFVALVAAACYVKTAASRLAHVYSTDWNDAGTCYIQSYIPQYSALGVAGSIAKMFTSEAFFRVYAKDGTLLKSSEWLLWQNEFTTDERSQWAGSHAIYPTVSGYEGWNIPACG